LTVRDQHSRGSSTGVVAYDEDLADRIRVVLAEEAHVTERKMFGGLAFLVNANMAVAASGQGGILVSADPKQTGPKGAEPAIMPRPADGGMAPSGRRRTQKQGSVEQVGTDR
jgi:hypothetical protein